MEIESSPSKQTSLMDNPHFLKQIKWKPASMKDTESKLDCPINDYVHQYAMSQPFTTQGTDHWKMVREELLTCSNAAAAIRHGYNDVLTPDVIPNDPGAQYASWTSLVVQSSRLNHPAFPKFEGNEHTRRGQKNEDMILHWAAEHYHWNPVVDYGVVRHRDPQWSMLGGSPDGITTDGILIEIKNPKFIPATSTLVPFYYEPQVQLLMHVFGCSEARFVRASTKGDTDDFWMVSTHTIRRAPTFMTDHGPRLAQTFRVIQFLRKHSQDIQKNQFRIMDTNSVLQDLRSCDDMQLLKDLMHIHQAFKWSSMQFQKTFDMQITALRKRCKPKPPSSMNLLYPECIDPPDIVRPLSSSEVALHHIENIFDVQPVLEESIFDTSPKL